MRSSTDLIAGPGASWASFDFVAPIHWGRSWVQSRRPSKHKNMTYYNRRALIVNYKDLPWLTKSLWELKLADPKSEWKLMFDVLSEEMLRCDRQNRLSKSPVLVPQKSSEWLCFSTICSWQCSPLLSSTEGMRFGFAQPPKQLLLCHDKDSLICTCRVTNKRV